jgi:hypothetical protein
MQNKENGVANTDEELVKQQEMHSLQAQICKYFILHAEDLTAKLSSKDMTILANSLYKTVLIENFSGIQPQTDYRGYNPWLWEHAYARAQALETDVQLLPQDE